MAATNEEPNNKGSFSFGYESVAINDNNVIKQQSEIKIPEEYLYNKDNIYSRRSSDDNKALKTTFLDATANRLRKLSGRSSNDSIKSSVSFGANDDKLNLRNSDLKKIHCLTQHKNFVRGRKNYYYTDGVDHIIEEAHLLNNRPDDVCNKLSDDVDDAIKIDKKDESEETHRETLMPKDTAGRLCVKANKSVVVWGKERMNVVLQREKLRKYVIIEIFGGVHKIREWQCLDILKNVHLHNLERNPTEHVPGQLTYRDCRQLLIDVHQVPSIEVRRHCICVCLPPVTCLILHDRVYLVVVEELKIDFLVAQLTELSKLVSISTDITNVSKTGSDNPFEFAALECIMSSAFEHLNHDINALEEQDELFQLLLSKNKNMSSVLLQELHQLKDSIGMYEDRVKAFDKALNAIIEDPEDLKKMELTKYYYNSALYNKKRQGEKKNSDLEILLEYFDQEVDQFTARMRYLKESVKNKERFIGFRLSFMRNQLIQLDLAATILATGIAIGTCVSGIFGMNMKNGFEDSYFTFVLVSCLIGFISAVTLIFVAYLLYTVRL